MSTIIVALIVVGSVIAIILALVYINNKHAETKQANYSLLLSEFGSAYNLSFTRYMTLKKRIIGLDAIRRKLVIVEEQGTQHHSTLIELDKVSSCSVEKIYTPATGTKSGKNYGEKALHSIVLQFNFDNREPALPVPFYESYFNGIYELPELEIKVSEWEKLLNKLIPLKVQKAS